MGDPASHVNEKKYLGAKKIKARGLTPCCLGRRSVRGEAAGEGAAGDGAREQPTPDASDPVRGANPRRPVFNLRPLPCERALPLGVRAL